MFGRVLLEVNDFGRATKAYLRGFVSLFVSFFFFSQLGFSIEVKLLKLKTLSAEGTHQATKKQSEKQIRLSQYKWLWVKKKTFGDHRFCSIFCP